MIPMLLKSVEFVSSIPRKVIPKTIGVCHFSVKYAILRNKSKDDVGSVRIMYRSGEIYLI